MPSQQTENGLLLNNEEFFMHIVFLNVTHHASFSLSNFVCVIFLLNCLSCLR